MSLDGIEAASNYKAISLVAFVWLKIIKKEKKIRRKVNTLESAASLLNTLEKADSSNKPFACL